MQQPNYWVNSGSDFCVRPNELVDTVVLHHTAMDIHQDGVDLNAAHINKPGGGWYMLGYHYVFGNVDEGKRWDGFLESILTDPIIQEGRPGHLVGAHASALMDKKDISPTVWSLLQDKGKIRCYKSSSPLYLQGAPRLLKNEEKIQQQIKNGNVRANITSIGIGVRGNLAKKSDENPEGYFPGSSHVLSENMTLSTDRGLSYDIGRFICHLKKSKYPHLKKIWGHNTILKTAVWSNSGGTCCPGLIARYLPRIINVANHFCDGAFEVDIPEVSAECEL